MSIRFSVLLLLWVSATFVSHGATVQELIAKAGNAPSDAARLLVLQELTAHPELSPAQRKEAERFTEEVDRYLNATQLDYFNGALLKHDDYDFGIAADSLFYPLTHLYRARMLIWVTMEHGRYWKDRTVLRARMERIRDLFERAHQAFPEEPLAPMYLGTPMPPATTYRTPDSAPAWAVAQREGLERLTDIIHWWIDHRLQEGGPYGGGWGDDCEMWRFWTAILIGFEDPKIRAAQESFSAALLAQPHMEGGYTHHLSDVEHTSEDSSDVITPMLHLAPESAVWQQRALRMVELSQELWMGRNERGQLQYKSTYFAIDQIDTQPKRACDTVYHPRVLQPALLLWQRTGDPALTRFISDWMDTWVDATARAERGKPAGVIPSAIHWPEGTVGGVGEHWWDPENHTMDPLYVFPSAMTQMTHTLLLTYHVTGEEKYLTPLRSMAQLRLDYLQNPPAETPEPGSAAWSAKRMGNLSSALSKYRLLTGSTEFDTLLKSGASTYARYRFWGDDAPVISALQQTATALGTNYPGYTSEVRYTDRVLRLPALYRGGLMTAEAVPGIGQPDPGLLYATVTGDPGTAGYFPMNAVRWLTPSRNIAALVTDSGTDRFTAKLYHFGDQPRSMGAEFYLLKPGTYTVTCGTQRIPLEVTGPRATVRFTLTPEEAVSLSVVPD